MCSTDKVVRLKNLQSLTNQMTEDAAKKILLALFAPKSQYVDQLLERARKRGGGWGALYGALCATHSRLLHPYALGAINTLFHSSQEEGQLGEAKLRESLENFLGNLNRACGQDLSKESTKESASTSPCDAQSILEEIKSTPPLLILSPKNNMKCYLTSWLVLSDAKRMILVSVITKYQVFFIQSNEWYAALHNGTFDPCKVSALYVMHEYGLNGECLLYARDWWNSL